MSIISIAMSAMFPPLFLRFENAACPGVSMNSIPGIFMSIFSCFIRCWQVFFSVSCFIVDAPIACVMFPASFDTIFVLIIVSSRLLFPWSTCPTSAHIIDLFSSIFFGCFF